MQANIERASSTVETDTQNSQWCCLMACSKETTTARALLFGVFGCALGCVWVVVVERFEQLYSRRRQDNFFKLLFWPSPIENVSCLARMWCYLALQTLRGSSSPLREHVVGLMSSMAYVVCDAVV
jgi:hypothetical protein